MSCAIPPGFSPKRGHFRVSPLLRFLAGYVLAAGGIASADTWKDIAGVVHTVNPTKVGIGISSPATVLYLRRDEGLAGERTWFALDRNGANNSTDPSISMGYRADGANATRVWMGAGNNFHLDFRTSGAPQAMSILNDGRVGIGITSPSERLHVAGNLKVTGTIDVAGVTTRNWTVTPPDYVFDPDYKLAPLEQVEGFLARNRHLPEVPSARQMEKDGLNLADMNLRLLKKVEELTLYAIEQQKKNRALEERVAKLENRRK